MPSGSNTRALRAIEPALHVRQTNVDSAASATAAIIVGAVGRLACALQMRGRCAVHSMTCQRALVLQRNGTRLAAEAPFVQQERREATVSFCADRSTAPRNGDVDRHSHHGEGFRADDAVTGRPYHSTVDGKIKGARCAAVGWSRNAGTSGTSREVRHATTACHVEQLIGTSRLPAPREHSGHDARR
jgi:hypothetical protein